MTLIINGEKKVVTAGLQVGELLQGQGVNMPEMVSVELNGEILDREVFETTHLKESDHVEFLYFMGGGAV